MAFHPDAVFKAAFDAFPSAVFIVDRRLMVLACNPAARGLTDRDPETIIGRLCGEAVQCFHEANSPEPCGETRACGLCVLRNALAETLERGAVVRKQALLRVTNGRCFREQLFRVSTAPLHHAEGGLALLILEEIGLFEGAGPLITICASCRVVRREERTWEPLEDFLKSHTATRFTHGICPGCLKTLYPEIAFDEPD